MVKFNFNLEKDVPSRQIMSIRAGGARELFIAYKLGLFKMNPPRRLKLLQGLLNIQRFFRDAKQFKEDIKKLQPEIRKEYNKISSNLMKRTKNFREITKSIDLKKYS